MSAIPGDLCCFFTFESLSSFSRYRASLADSYTDRRIDDLLILATCRLLLQRYSPANLMVPLLMEALDNAWYDLWRPLTNLMQTFRVSQLCTFNVAAIFILGSSLHMAYYRTPWCMHVRISACSMHTYHHKYTSTITNSELRVMNKFSSAMWACLLLTCM